MRSCGATRAICVCVFSERASVSEASAKRAGAREACEGSGWCAVDCVWRGAEPAQAPSSIREKSGTATGARYRLLKIVRLLCEIMGVVRLKCVENRRFRFSFCSWSDSCAVCGVDLRCTPTRGAPVPVPVPVVVQIRNRGTHVEPNRTVQWADQLTGHGRRHATVVPGCSLRTSYNSSWCHRLVGARRALLHPPRSLPYMYPHPASHQHSTVQPQVRALHAAHHGPDHARASVDGIVTAS